MSIAPVRRAGRNRGDAGEQRIALEVEHLGTVGPSRPRMNPGELFRLPALASPAEAMRRERG
jgi:hypothetical protein